MPSPLITRDPAWGYDAIRAVPPAAVPAIARSLGHGEDTIKDDIGLLTPGLQAYGSYIDNFGGFPELVARFGKTRAFLLSYTIFGGPAICGDFEPGALNNGDVGRLYGPHGELLRDEDGFQWAYTNAGNMAALKSAIVAAHGNIPVRYQSAHYGAGEHLCAPAVCGFPSVESTQWADTGASGQNVDRSVWAVVPSTRPRHTQPDLRAFFPASFKVANGQRLNERGTAKLCNALLANPHKNAFELKGVQPECQALADRIAEIVLAEPKKHGHHDWSKFRRGTRYRLLTGLAHGHRLPRR